MSSTPAVRPLPARPSLEFERKRAKRTLRALRRTDPDAQLADAQRIAAREYGFTSWPRLIEYFTTWERHERTGPLVLARPREHWDAQVRSLIAGHGRRSVSHAQRLATFVPRFYGRSDAEIFDAPFSEADAQLVIAREYRYPNWPTLLDTESRGRDAEPLIRASAAARERDFDTLAALIDAHPELITTPEGVSVRGSILHSALMHEIESTSDESRDVTDWLVAHGAALQPVLNRMLIGHIYLGAEYVAYLLDRGADPSWMPPNGITILEHSLLRYWNPVPVDLIARRVTPRRAFWIAAELGDVAGVASYFDRRGALTDAARRDRPDFTACSLRSGPSRPEADDVDVLWEAFLVAGMNHRLAVLDALLDRGFPIDYDRWGSTLHDWAAGNRITAVADHLAKRGARH